MKKWILALALCLTLCMLVCFAAADDGNTMVMPEWDEITMPRTVNQGDTVTVQTPIGQNIGAIKLTIKDTDGWNVKLTEVKNVSEAVDGKLAFSFGTVAQSGFELGHQYYVELMALPTEDSPADTWEGYWDRILTVVPNDSLAGLQMFFNSSEIQANTYEAQVGFFSLYVTAYDPLAENVWIVYDGEAVRVYQRNSVTVSFRFNEPGTHEFYAVSMKADGTQTTSEKYYVQFKTADHPELYINGLTPVSYLNGSIEDLPGTLTAGTDITYTIHPANQPDLGLDAAGLVQQIWYDVWLDDLTDENDQIELPCYLRRQEPEVPHVADDHLLNENTGDRTIRIADYCELQPGHTYQLGFDIRSAGCTPAHIIKTFTVLPEETDSEHTIALSFGGDAAGQSSVNFLQYEDFRLHASAPDATMVRFWKGDGFEYLNNWIGGDWTGEFDFDWKTWDPGTYQYYIQAYYGEIDETPWDQMEWDPACISNILTVNATQDSSLEIIIPEYTTSPETNTVTQGDYYTVTQTNADDIAQAGAYTGADLSNGNDVWNHYDNWTDHQLLIPTADLEPGYYCLSVYTETPGAGYASNPTFFRVTAPASYPDNHFLITTTVPAANGTYTVETSEDFGVTFYVPDREGYWKYYRFFDGRDWWGSEWWDRSVTLNLSLSEPGEYGIYAEAVFVPEEEGQDEIRIQSDPLPFTVTSNGDSGIRLSAPGSYILTENQEGYTATIIFPDEFDFSRTADRYWELVLQTTYGPDLMRFGSYRGDNPQEPLTFPAELFEAGETYQIWLHMDVRGYDHVHEEVCFAAFDEPEENQPELSLTVNGDDAPAAEILAHENFRVKVTKDDSITAVRVLNGNNWEYWWGGDSYTRDWGFGDGIYGLVAQGTTDDPIWDTEGFDWDQFDWNRDVNWNVTSNVITLQVTAPYGKLGSPTLTLDQEEYTRGEIITATIGKADGSEWYGLHVCPVNEDGNPEGDWVYDISTESTGTGELILTIPTAHIEPGKYAVWVDNNATGYRGNGTGNVLFTVTESGEDPQAVLEMPETANTNENIQIYAYVPGADDIRLEIRKQGEDGWQNDRNRGGNYAVWEFGEAFRGTYIFTLYGNVNGEEVQAAGPAELEVLAENGDLNEATIEGVPDVLILGEGNNGIAGTFTKDNRAEWYQVSLVYRGPSGDWWGDEIENDFRDGEEIDNEFAYGPEDFTQNGIYEVHITGGATGYNGTDTRKRILAVFESPEDLTLTVNGSTEERQELLSSRNIRVKVTYDENPTAVRILNGDHFEYWWGDDNFERDWGFGDGEVFMFAEGTWDAIDFEALEENGWGEFDWDRDVNWTGRSNIILLNITSPYGEMSAPSFTLNTDENGQIPWGEDLVITVADEGPTGPDADSGEPVIIQSGWFFFNLDAERWNEYGSWWDRVSNEFNYQVHSGENHIPTYILEGGCRYRIEIGADAEGYSGRSTWIEFTLGDREETEEPIRDFRVNGGTEDLSVLTHEDLQLTAYRSGAEWYNVEITREDDEDWFDHRDDCRSGMLMDWWRTDTQGTFTLKAYAYGHLYDEDGNITQDENGYDFWEEEIGTVTVTVTAPHGDLGELSATMADKAYVGDPIEIAFEPVTGTDLNPDDVEYSYWIHSDNDGGWIMGNNRYGAGTLTIDTSRLESGVYWVELDAMANGYNQSHATLHFALLDENDTEHSTDTRYFTISCESVPTETDVHIIAYLPGADGVQLWFRKDNNTDLEEVEFRDGPGLSSWFCRGDSGEYQIYISSRSDNGWSEPEYVCTLEITAEHTFGNEPRVTINGSEEGNTVPADGDNPQRMTISISKDMYAEGYHVRIGEYGDGWPVFEEFISLDGENRDERVTIEANTVDIILEDGRIQPGRLYEADCWVHATGYECLGSHRTFLLQPEGQQDPDFELTISSKYEDPDEYWTDEEAWVYACAEGATAIKLCMNNEVRFYRGDRVGTDFTVWDEDTLFYAYATNDPIPEDDDFNWFDLDVNWSRQAEPVWIHANTEGDTLVPSLTFTNPVTRGDWLEFTIGDDGDARQMDIRIRDEWGNIVEFRRCWAPGTYRLPTANLNPDQRYWVDLTCVQHRHLWTMGPQIELYVNDPGEQDAAFFKADKTELYPGETFIPSVYAPGANHIWIGDGNWNLDPENHDGIWGDWEGNNGTNNADWEWWYDDPGEFELIAWARNEETGIITEIGRVQFTILAPEPLARAEILVPHEVDATEINCIYIDPIEYGYYYRLEIHSPTDPDFQYGETKTVQDIDEDHNHLAFIIPANTLQANQSYWIDCYVDPADRDCAHSGSDSSKNIMTTDGGSTDSNITVALEGDWDHEDEDGEIYRYLIPINTPFGVTVSAGPTAGLPTAIAVYMGDHTEYRFFNEADGSETTEYVGLSEYQAWPETLYVRACYEDLSMYDGWGDVPWDELAWGAPSNTIRILFTSGGQAEPAEIFNHFATITGRNIVVQVTLGEYANEAHANLDYNVGGWENWVFGDWFPMEEDPENPGTGTITIPTDGLPIGTYRLHVDNSGPGHDNGRTTAWLLIVEDPYQSASKLELPSGLTTIEAEAFEGIAADTVIIPDGVTTIGRRAFADSNVRLVLIPASVTEIGEEAFAGSQLEVVYAFNLGAAFECAGDYDATYCYAGE